MKLISMTDFVLEEGNPSNTDEQFTNKVMAYANFIKQPLELWMFVPCDEDGNVLEESGMFKLLGDIDGDLEQQKHQQAKERCLFEGFECQKQGKEILVTFDKNPVWVNWNNSKIIENLVYLKPQLTQTTIKQLGL